MLSGSCFENVTKAHASTFFPRSLWACAGVSQAASHALTLGARGAALGRGQHAVFLSYFMSRGWGEPLLSEFTCATSTKPFCRAIDRKRQCLGVLVSLGGIYLVLQRSSADLDNATPLVIIIRHWCCMPSDTRIVLTFFCISLQASASGQLDGAQKGSERSNRFRLAAQVHVDQLWHNQGHE